MSDSFFSFPEPDKTSDDVDLLLDDKNINHWLQELPLADIERAAPEFLEFLEKINQVKMGPEQRCNILKTLLKRSKDIRKTLRDKYIRAQLPMNLRASKCYQLAIDINKEIIISEKITIADLLKSQSNEKEHIMALVSCLYFAVHYASLLLLESYLVYSTDQKEIWHELNQIYTFSEKHSLQDIAVATDSNNETTETINTAYARAALLSMANPFYLMQEESLAVFQLLKKIAKGIQISSQPIVDKHKAIYYIDLQSDQEPSFITPESLPVGEIRYFIVAKLQNMLAANMDRLDSSIQSLREQGQSATKAQSQRDMLTRLHNSWGKTGTRAYDRFDIQGQVEMSIGLSASHHNISGELRFTPELDEILIHTKGAGIKSSGLSLMPLDHEPWKAEEAEKRIEAGVDSFRSSSFDEKNASLDAWEKIYSAKAKQESEEEFFELKKSYALSFWNIHNKSIGGLSLHCETDRHFSIHVGDVVAFQTDDSSSDAVWISGCIRWLRSKNNNTLEAGIMIINYKTNAVACRSVQGHGEGSEYLRCLLVGADELDDDLATLLTPAYIYNLGTILAINIKNRIVFVQLTESLLNTRSLAQYKFELVDTPDTEAANISKIQELM